MAASNRMRPRPPRIFSFVNAIFVVAALVCARAAMAAEVSGGAAPTGAVAQAVVHYYDDVKPLLAVHCYKCHTGDAAKGGLHLDVRESVLTPRRSGKTPAVAGDVA